MSIKIAINGFGRIGRLVLRAIFELNRKEFEIVSINSTSSIDETIHLLKYDSIHGIFNHQVSAKDNKLLIDDTIIPLQKERDINKLDWNGVDILFECTGKFNDRDSASLHLSRGTRKVIVSAPCSNADSTIVFGVNNSSLKKEHQIVSVGSCTTNCLAPLAKVLNDKIGIEAGFMTTIHSYTNDQRILDGSHKDMRRARAASVSMIPTSTGAAKALGLVIPELAGKLDGSAVRVPTPNVSMIDFCFTSSQDTSVEKINSFIREASNDVIKIAPAPLVSIDFTHNSASSIFDPYETKVVNKRFCRVVAWYDNEWGFSIRMLDVAKLFSELL